MLEADFQREYQIDLAKAFFGPEPMSIRRFAVLLRNLSTEAIFRHVMRDELEEAKKAEDRKPATPAETMRFFKERGAVKSG